MTTQLPPMEEFKNLYGKVDITESEYIMAGKAWQIFGTKDLFSYMQMYCMIDVVSCKKRIAALLQVKGKKVRGILLLKF